jgi:ribonuclease P protein component
LPGRTAASFGPERRIKRRADFLRVQEAGQRASTPHFVLLVAKREPGKPGEEGGEAKGKLCARLGIVVTRKVGNAVQRNRIKRVCRECFRLWPRDTPLVPDGIDLVVIAREGAHELGLAEVRDEWLRAHSTLTRRCKALA